MRTGSTPEDHPSAATGGPQNRATPSDFRDAADDVPALPVTGERRARLQDLAGVSVLGSDGAQVGRVRDVYLHDATGELAAITVVHRQLSSRAVLVPTSAIAVLPAARTLSESAADGGAAGGEGAADGEVARRGATDAKAADGEAADAKAPGSAHPQSIRLLVDAATAKEGNRAPMTSHATPQELRAAAEALGVREAPTA